MAAVHKTNGEGSIIHDTAGGRDRWIFQYCIYDVHGKRKRRSITRRTKTELLKAIDEFRQEIKPNDVEKINEIRCSEWIEKWLENIKHTVKPGTLRFYTALMKNVTPKVRMKKLNAVEVHHIQEMLNFLLEHGGKAGKGLSSKSVRSLRTTLISCFENALENGFISKNVVKKSKPPRLIQKKIRYLDSKQVRTLLEVAENGDYLVEGYRAGGKKAIDRAFVTERNAMIIRLAVATGMRRGEIFGLCWDDVDSDNSTINIHQALVNGKIAETKTPYSVRKIRTDKTTMIKLMEWHSHQEQYEEMIPMFKNKNNLVFTNKYGNPIDVDTFRTRHFEKIVAYAGLPKDLTLHSLRHTFATLLLANGVPANVVCSKLGHSTPYTTMTVYAHVTTDMDQSAVDMMGTLLDGTETNLGNKNN